MRKAGKKDDVPPQVLFCRVSWFTAFLHSLTYISWEASARIGRAEERRLVFARNRSP
jgi:hypothetical protein